MARRIVHQLVDDLDGTVLEVGEGETMHFSLDGVAYEIDLTEDNAAAFRAALAPYRDAARSTSGARATASRGGSAGARQQRRGGQRDFAPIRKWAKDNGYQISDRGRVPASVIDAYEAAH